MTRSADHFWKKVDIGGPKQCWNWTGSTLPNGYGQCYWDGRQRRAHRIAALLHGLIDTIAAPKNRKGGGFVLHRCDNKLCCNPKHLFVGSYSDNLNDAYDKGVMPKGENRPSSKLTNTQVKEIRRRYYNGSLQRELAIEYGVANSYVSLLVNNRRRM